MPNSNGSNKQFEASNERSEGYKHVLLITTGSVASVKAPLIVEELLQVRCLHLYSFNLRYILLCETHF